MAKKKRLGEMLREAGLIDEIQLKSALGHQKQWGKKLGASMIEMGMVTEDQIAGVLEQQLGVKCTSLDDVEVTDETLRTIKGDVAKKYGIFPISFDGKTLTIAMSDPSDLKTLDDLQFLLSHRIVARLALESDIHRAIERHYEGVEPAGKVHRIDKEKLAESVRTMEIERGTAIYQDTSTQAEVAPAPAPPEPPHEEHSKAELSNKKIIEALINLLVRKGVITKEEIIRAIRGAK